MGKYRDSLVKNINALLDADQRDPAWLIQKVNVKPSTVYKLLKDPDRGAKLETLEALEVGLGLKPGDLLKDHNSFSLKKAELLALVDRLSTDAMIDDAIDYLGGLLGETALDESETTRGSRLK